MLNGISPLPSSPSSVLHAKSFFLPFHTQYMPSGLYAKSFFLPFHRQYLPFLYAKRFPSPFHRPYLLLFMLNRFSSCFQFTDSICSSCESIGSGCYCSFYNNCWDWGCGTSGRCTQSNCKYLCTLPHRRLIGYKLSRILYNVMENRIYKEAEIKDLQS